MKKIFFPIIVFLSLQGQCQTTSLQTFPLSEVSLQQGPFYRAQQADMKYMLELDPDRLLAPYLIDAGLPSPKERYGNWENTGLAGHIGGHYLTALSLMYASTQNKELLDRLNYMIDKLAECQEKNGNGYVGGIPGGQPMWEEIRKGNINAGSFSLNGKWVPLYNIHKLFAGLRDAYLVAGNKKAKDILIKLSDWFYDLTANLSDEQIQEMLRSEQGGLNEVFADVSVVTGDKKYLTLAKRFSHRLILNPLIEHKDQLDGLHANMQIPKIIGFKRISELAGDTTWSDAAAFFWKTVVENRTVSIGGNSVREHFNPENDFTSMIESNQGPETCNTYNMLRLTKMLFLTDPEVKYMDYYERALYNHILSSEHPKGGFVYFTPMRPRHYRVYSQPDQSFWCCVGSGLENHGKYGELIYARAGNDLYVNLFIPSTLSWQEKGITVVQDTKFPDEETSRIKLTLTKPQKFAIKVRHPSWVKKDEFKVMINGKPFSSSSSASSYAIIERTWKSGDVITVTLPMHNAVEYLPDGSSWGSFLHGPIVLAAATDTTDLGELWADDSRMGHVASGKLYPIDGAPVIVKRSDDFVSQLTPLKGQPLTFSVSELVDSEKYKNLKLVPFYTIHEKRYMIYWPVVTPKELEQRKLEMKEREKIMLELEARTVDQVAPGEQQPEKEHNMQGEKMETGMHRERFWRDAHGWFSYDLVNKDGKGKILRITYFGGDRNRTFDILLNGKLFKTVTMDASHGEEFYDVDYPISSDFLKNGANDNILTVKFVAHEGSVAGGIYDVRLLKPE